MVGPYLFISDFPSVENLSADRQAGVCKGREKNGLEIQFTKHFS